jgi:hypothetical protein
MYSYNYDHESYSTIVTYPKPFILLLEIVVLY